MGGRRRGWLAAGFGAVAVALGGGFKAVEHLLAPASHEHVPVRPFRPPPIPVGPVIDATGAPSKTRAAVERFVGAASDSAEATPDAARKAGTGAACNVLYVVATDGRFPTSDEWIRIGTDALASAAIDAPLGSAVWLRLEQLKAETETAVTSSLGLPSSDEAHSVAEDLACAWA